MRAGLSIMQINVASEPMIVQVLMGELPKRGFVPCQSRGLRRARIGARGRTFTYPAAKLPARTHPRRCSLALTRTHPHGHLNKQTHVCTHTHTQSHTRARARTHTTTRAARAHIGSRAQRARGTCMCAVAVAIRWHGLACAKQATRTRGPATGTLARQPSHQPPPPCLCVLPVCTSAH